MLALLRPDNIDLPLFVHVAGALVLVGTLVAALVMAVSGSPSRLTFRALLWAAIPAWIVMRGGAEWVADKEGLADLEDPPSWIDIGFMTSDPAFLAILIATVIAGLSSRKGAVTSRWVSGLISFSVVLALVAVWAMTAKPA